MRNCKQQELEIAITYIPLYLTKQNTKKESIMPELEFLIIC